MTATTEIGTTPVSSTAPATSRQRLRARLRPDHPGVVLAVLLLAQLMIVLDANVVTVALPQIQRALHFSAANLTWVMSAYTLTLGGLLLLGARAGDQIGRRRIFLVGMTVFTVASLLAGFATQSWWLIATRALQGGGAALASPSILALLTSTFTEGRARNRALAWFAAASISGAAVGLIAGGVLVQWLSWRWVMFVNVPIGVLLVAAARLVLPETSRTRSRVDALGAVLSTAGMAAVVFGLVHAAGHGWAARTSYVSLLTGAILLGVFVATQRRSPAPMLPLSVFSSRTRTIAYTARVLLVAGAIGNFYFLSLLFQDELGYGPLQTGLAFLPITVAIFLTAQFSGRVLVERFAPAAVVGTGMLVTAAALVVLLAADASSGYPLFLLSFLVMGVGNGISFGPLTALGLANVSPELVGTASGMVNVAQQVGASLGLAVLTSVFGSAGRHAGSSDPTVTFFAGAHASFACGAACLVLGSLLMVSLARRRRTA